jgi:hypothetical protein
MPAFAEETVAAETADLQSYGVVAGDDTGANEEGVFIRAQLAVMLSKLYGKQEEAEAYDLPTTFEDLTGDDYWDGYTPYIAYAKVQGWMSGDNDTTFRPMDPLKAQEINAAFVKALGFTVAWEDVNAKATELEIAVDAADPTLVLRGEAFKAIRAALDVTPEGAEVTLGEELALEGYEAPEAPVVEPEVVEAVSATALNFREIEVEFNTAVDAAELADKANYTVTGYTVNYVTAAADNKSAVLFLTSNLTAGATASVVVGTDIVETATTLTTAAVVDGSLPSVVSVLPVGNSAIKITFSEPVQTIGNPADYKLDGLFFAQSAVPAVNTSADGRVVTITPASRLAAGEHTLTVSSTVTDFATYGLTADRTFTFNVADDSVAAAVSFVSATQKQVVVKFSEAVDKTLVEAAAITFTNGVTKNVATLGADLMTLTVTVNGTLPVGGTTTMTIPKAGAVDTFGNVPAADLSVVFTGVADTERPAVTGVMFDEKVQNKMYVQFSKEVALDGTYTITETKSDATTAVTTPAPAYYVDTTVTPNVTDKTKIVLTQAFDETSSYSLVVADVTDTPNPLANKILDYAVSGLVVADLTAPVYVSTIVEAQAMYFTFDSAVVLPAASSFVYVKSNDMVVNGLPTGATVELVNDAKTVKVTFKTVAADATNGIDPSTIKQIQYSGFVGADGNAVTANVVLNAAFTTATAAPSFGAVEVTGKNTITVAVTNSTNLIFNAGQALADFEAKLTAYPTTLLNLVNASYDSTKALITFTTYEDISSAATISGSTITVGTKATTTMVDLFDQKIAVSDVAVAADKYAPMATAMADSGDKQTFNITVSEALAGGASLASGEFIVTNDGALVPATISYSGSTITVTLGSAAVATDVVKVEFVPFATTDWTDAMANKLGAFELTVTVE